MNAVDDLGMAGGGGADGERKRDSPASPDVADPGTSAVAATQMYRSWGWPVTVQGEQVRLDLDSEPGRGVDAVAVALLAGLADQVAEVLAVRRCAPAMLAHPGLDSHRVIVTGERFGVPLSWPPGVHRITDTLLLPPTPTVHGPLRWVRPPTPLALRLCREVDVRAALSTVLRGCGGAHPARHTDRAPVAAHRRPCHEPGSPHTGHRALP
ncbi:MAG: hypothetical protein ACRDRV_11440 [Pseudonocardiaceae bacterium]